MAKRHRAEARDTAPAISSSTSNGHTPELVNQSVARSHFVERLLSLLDGQEADLTQETTWEQLGRLVVKHWIMFDAQQSSVSTLKMVQGCAEMKLKIRLAQQRSPTGATEDLLAEYESLMQDVFAPDEGTPLPEVPHPDEDDDADLDPENDSPDEP